MVRVRKDHSGGKDGRSMRPFVIVTLRDEYNRINYDVELPTDVPVKRLYNDIEEALKSYAESVPAGSDSGSLYCERMGKDLPGSSTFAELGIWSGDILIMR